MMHVVFAIPFAMENTLRFARAAAGLSGVQMSVVSQDSAERLPRDLREKLVGFAQVADAVRCLARRIEDCRYTRAALLV